MDHCTLIPMAVMKKKKLAIFGVGEDVEQLKFSKNTDGNLKWYSHFAQQFCTFLKS